MKNEEWAEETRRRLFKVSKYFKANEYVVIWDFIKTAEDEGEV